jgi:hypothetical protein
MSGRSAYVRKEKTKTKDVSGENGSEKSGSIHGDFPLRSSGKSMYRERDSQSRATEIIHPRR